VLIDIPKNIQMGKTQPMWLNEVNLRGYKPGVECGDAELNELDRPHPAGEEADDLLRLAASSAATRTRS
jgi:hypothetical protein